MPVQSHWWDEEQTTFYYNISGEWTFQEVCQTAQQGNRQIASVPHQVNVIVDMRGISGFPDGVLAHMQPHRIAITQNTVKVYTFLPDTPLTRMFLSIYKRMYGLMPEHIVIVLDEMPEQIYTHLAQEMFATL